MQKPTIAITYRLDPGLIDEIEQLRLAQQDVPRKGDWIENLIRRGMRTIRRRPDAEAAP